MALLLLITSRVNYIATRSAFLESRRHQQASALQSRLPAPRPGGPRGADPLLGPRPPGLVRLGRGSGTGRRAGAPPPMALWEVLPP